MAFLTEWAVFKLNQTCTLNHSHPIFIPEIGRSDNGKNSKNAFKKESLLIHWCSSTVFSCNLKMILNKGRIAFKCLDNCLDFCNSEQFQTILIGQTMKSFEVPLLRVNTNILSTHLHKMYGPIKYSTKHCTFPHH